MRTRYKFQMENNQNLKKCNSILSTILYGKKRPVKNTKITKAKLTHFNPMFYFYTP